MKESAGLYIHIPFCSAICFYCDFYRVTARSGVPKDYEKYILKEASLYAEDMSIPVDTVYLGGGTPSLLEGNRIASLLTRLGEIFDISRDAEISLEANPEDITPESLSQWKSAGITRLSIGVQSFDDVILKRLGRRASSLQAKEALEASGKAGIRHLSADLMIGVPGQDTASFRGDLNVLSSTGVNHVSVYALDLHPGSRLFKDVKMEKESVPKDDLVSDLYDTAHQFLCDKGFEHYEVSNFASRGERSRHNMKYWKCSPTLGLGPSSWSRINGRLTGNHRTLVKWKRELEEGNLPCSMVEETSPLRLAEDRVIFGLRTSEGVPWPECVEELGVDANEALRRADKLVDSGYAIFDRGKLSLTSSGFLASSEIILYLLYPTEYVTAEAKERSFSTFIPGNRSV